MVSHSGGAAIETEAYGNLWRADATEEVYVAAGDFTERVAIGGAELEAFGSERDAFLVAFTPDGQLLMFEALSSDGAVRGADVAIGTAGRVWLGGSFEGELSWRGNTLTSDGSGDGYLVRLEL